MAVTVMRRGGYDEVTIAVIDNKCYAFARDTDQSRFIAAISMSSETTANRVNSSATA